MELLNQTYRILQVLGTGGMSTVYLAEHIRLHTLVAVKQMARPQQPGDSGSEYRLLSRLHHPMLPCVMDAFAEGGYQYLVEEYVRGRTLQQVLQQEGKIPESSARAWMAMLCDVLQYLHSQTPPIVYRDLKPSNIMLCPDGSLKLLDFGIAREAREETSGSSSHAGSYGYCAPEQFGHGVADARTDIYSLGMTFHHLLTGKSPFDPPYRTCPVRRLDPSLSVGIEYILNKCTQLNPARRYADTAALRYDLEHIYLFEGRYRAYRLRLAARRLLVCALLAGSFALMGTGLRQIVTAARTPQADFYADGLALMQQEQYETAIETFSQALDDPGEHTAGEIYLARGDAYRQAALQEPDRETARTLFEQAEADYASAEELSQGQAADRRASVQQQLDAFAAEDESLAILQQFYDLLEAGDVDTVFSLLSKDIFYRCLQNMQGDTLVYCPDDAENGIAVYRNVSLLYYGALVDGQREGHGILLGLLKSGNDLYYRFDGEWKGGFPNGSGTVWLKNTTRDSGQYVDSFQYSGNFSDGLLDGQIDFSLTWVDRDPALYYRTETTYHSTPITAVDGLLQPVADADRPAWYSPPADGTDEVLVGYDDDRQEPFTLAPAVMQETFGVYPFANVLALV